MNPSVEPYMVVNQLNVLFVDALQQFPTALRFDLPYGGPDPAELSLPRESESQWQDLLAREAVYPPTVEVRQGTLVMVDPDSDGSTQPDAAARTGTALVRISALGVIDVDQ